MKIGAQLYTVHEYTKNLDDFSQTLRKVSEIGYKYVQVSGTCEFEADWLKEQLEKYGLECVVTHTPQKKITENIEKVMADHKVFGCKYIGISGIEGLWDTAKTLEECYEVFKNDYAPQFETLKQNGFYFMYHNHNQELCRLKGDDKFLLRRIAEDYPADQVGFILDTHWLQRGGIDPAKFIRELKGRVPCVHFKDYITVRTEECTNDTRFAVIGEGVLDFKEIIEACEYAGTEYVLVEQDNCYGEDPFECLRRSYNNLKEMGLE